MKITSLSGIITDSQISLFLQKIKKTDYCWEWTSSTNSLGYGKFRIGSSGDKTRCICGAHRISYMLFKGDIPSDLIVCHSCDNPKCVNPEHLWLGTYKDNVDDKIIKGRDLRGERHQNSKLTLDSVREIRETYKYREVSMAKLGAKYGVTPSVIHDIVHGLAWINIDQGAK